MDNWSENGAANPKQAIEKPSRWWILYHFWCGICVKVYADISGLSKLIVGSPSGSGPAFASNYATLVAMVAVGAVATGYFLSKYLIRIIDRSPIPKNGKMAIKSILPFSYFLLAIFLSKATGPVITKSLSSQTPATQVSQESKEKPVTVLTTTRSSRGLTQSALDLPALKSIETWVVKTIGEKGRKNYAEMGHDPKNFQPAISSRSVYVDVDGERLGVINVNIENSMRSVTIIGIKEGKILQVSCIRASDHDISIWSGKCGNEVSKAFGVTVRP